MQTLLQSRKFWLMIVDVVVSTLSVVLTWFFAKEVIDRIMLLVGIWQPVVVAVIYGITKEDEAKLQAGVHPSQTPPEQ